MTYRRGVPERSELNTIWLASGLNEGEVSMPGSEVRRDSWRLRRSIT